MQSNCAWFPMGRDLKVIVADWVKELTTVHLFGPDDPLFPATAIGLDNNGQLGRLV